MLELPAREVERSRFTDLLLRGSNGVDAGDEQARRWLLPGYRDERSRELGRFPGLLAILSFPILE